MKLCFIPSLLSLLTLLSSGPCQAQSDREGTEKISREFALTGDAGRSTLALYNINGSVTVEGYNGNRVVVEATKTIRADNAQLLEQGKKEAQVGFMQRNDSVVVYLQGPHDSRPQRLTHRRNEYHGRIDYSYEFNFVVKVPAGMKVDVSTVNGGKLLVQNVTGPLQARNVNGAVVIQNAREATLAHTVNGNVEVSYAAAPTNAASYHTINGNIVVSYPPNVSADLYFKSMHGEMFTDFPSAEVLPARVSQNQQNTGQGTKYKLSKETAVRLGKGGPDFRFETLNGDVTIKQQPR
ncbi:DUF4097 family beta strand repeat-containing protein [Hymenobacter sp. CRA2]|uniref:DUF4097 family beta strand repeat-containing protein n=1 Tax=Hymenobacter sp. CRA2 TaxID=1955620 RepID=UPI00098EF368|nr:hypothetical protein [Hymenobacter sp. CRA2]OON69707.1 hypothetical protein B0919_07190 [Hymenobacter sp. CRA2]